MFNEDQLYAIQYKFSKLVRDRRIKMKLTQEELANQTFLKRTVIHDIERGRRLTFKSVIIMAEFFDISLDSIIRNA